MSLESRPQRAVPSSGRHKILRKGSMPTGSLPSERTVLCRWEQRPGQGRQGLVSHLQMRTSTSEVKLGTGTSLHPEATSLRPACARPKQQINLKTKTEASNYSGTAESLAQSQLGTWCLRKTEQGNGCSGSVGTGSERLFRKATVISLHCGSAPLPLKPSSAGSGNSGAALLFV